MAESAREALERQLSNYPNEAFEFFRTGLSAAGKTSEGVREKILQQLIEQFKSGSRRLDGTEISDITGLSRPVSDAIAAAYSMIIGLLTDTNATPEEFIEVARGKFISQEDEKVGATIAASICGQRDEIKRSVEKSQLAGAVLPSLYSFDVTVDIRFKVEDGGVKATVPVAIVHLDTDANDQEVWVQLTAGDIELIIKRLREAQDGMKIAESLLQK